MMRIATFNVNSIRARMPVLDRWLRESQPDVVALQETKVEDASFPFAELEELGYGVEFHGQQKYNGVAILSKLPIEDAVCGILEEGAPRDCRLLAATVGGVRIFNSYVPNGTSVGSEKFFYKLEWLRRFRRLCDQFSPSDPMLWLGDVNIAPTPDDVFEPERKLGRIGHHPDEFVALGEAVDWGWTDVFRTQVQGPGHYTFWEYRIPKAFERNLGWRIDHIYASPGLLPRCGLVTIEREPRTWERPSDHVPVSIEITT